MPYASKECPQLSDLLVGFDNLDQALPLLLTHALVGLEQQVAVFPQALCQRPQLPLIPRRGRVLAIALDLAPPRNDPPPQMSPGILQDVKVVVLDGHRRPEDRTDRIVIGPATIDVKSLQLQPQGLHPLQKWLDRLLSRLSTSSVARIRLCSSLSTSTHLDKPRGNSSSKWASVIGCFLFSATTISSLLSRESATSSTHRHRADFDASTWKSCISSHAARR